MHADSSQRIKFEIVLDYDAKGNFASLEILDASQRITRPTRMEYELAA